MVLGVVIVVVGFLAYANGTSDNFKGVVSLLGSNITGYRTVLL